MSLSNFKSPSVLAPLLLLIATTVVSELCSKYVAERTGISAKITFQFLYAVLALMGSMILIYGLRHYGGQIAEELFGDIHKSALLAIILGVMITGGQFGVEALVEFPMAILDPNLATRVYKLSPDATPAGSLLLNVQAFSFFLMYVIATPILEELVFRAYIFRRISSKYGITLGLIISSFVFGLFHWPHILSETFIGVMFGSIYVRYRSLMASILAHASANLTIMVGLSFTAFPFKKDIHHLSRFINWWPELISLSIGVLVFIYAALRLWPAIKKDQHKSSDLDKMLS